jgi:hypothetical protein
MMNIKKLSEKLGTDGFSLVLCRTKVTDSEVFASTPVKERSLLSCFRERTYKI